jgi:choline dehydrogenase-like flavoprotein
MDIMTVLKTENSDYIIIGAGPGGCVLANHQSEAPNVSVPQVETGERDPHPLIHMPAGSPS